MSDKDLTELHAQGREALRPGAWEVIDEELRRRARVGARQPRSIDSEEERYPAIRTIVVLLKGLAIAVLLACVLATIFAVRADGPVAFLFLVAGFLTTVTYWAAAELLVLLMDIEANTRALRRDAE